jgi:Glycosyl hydrolase family 26
MTSIFSPTISAVNAPLPTASALGFRSWGGVYNDTQHAATETWLGRKVPWIMCTTDRKTGPATMLATCKRNVAEVPVLKRSRINCVMTICLAYGTDNAQTAEGKAAIKAKLDRTAAGDHDTYYSQAATCLKESGFKNVIVRLGHESNGAWYPWSAIDNAASYIAAYRHVVGVMRAASPTSTYTLKFEYNLARANIATTGAASYPGDAYVDSIGLDLYYRPDTYPNQVFTTTWSNLLKPALDTIVQMAKDHNKPWSVAEWAVEDKDDDDYIVAMASYFATNTPLFHIYFGPPQERYDLANYPTIKATYKTKFGKATA